VAKREFNSFDQLYFDAEELLTLAEQPTYRDSFVRTQLSRTAVLLFVVSLEGLINRVMEAFLPEHLREFFTGRDQRMSFEEKWFVTPLLISGRSFDRARTPWAQFVELVKMRNEMVHPKPDRPAYVKFVGHGRFENLTWKEIPRDLPLKESDLVYRQTLIPRNPADLETADVRKVKQVVDAMVAELDALLDGRITKDDWLRVSKIQLIHPPGARFT
jgi:hypothetical protein